MKPDGSAALVATLNDLMEKGDVASALATCRERLDRTPDDADAHRHLSQLRAAIGEFAAARRSGRRACELAPEDPRCWSDLGRVHALEGRFRDAAASFAAALRADARHADAWHNLGVALKRLGDRPGAFTALRTALLVDPARAETYLNLGALLIDAGQLEDALECFERAAKHDPRLARARRRLARHFSQTGRVRRAESLFRQSLELDPDHIEGWLGLGRALEDLGEADGALSCYQQALARRPANAWALSQYLALARGCVDRALLDRAHAALRDPQARDDAKALVGYGLVKHHDRRKDYCAAASAASLANAARRRATGALDRDGLEARVGRIIAAYDRDFFLRRRRFGLGTDQPVFIVGLPRSGTTLTERIIDAHPLLHGAGELPDLGRLAARAAAERSPEPGPTWQAAQLLAEPARPGSPDGEMASRMLARRYLDALRAGAPKRRLRISDKSPLNFFHLAFAALLFPNARVIHCTRDARDNALSIWLENFSEEQPWATDFSDLAFYRSQYLRLMDHWRAQLPLPVLDVVYEDTVADLEKQARRIMDFLGAPWSDVCLDFHRNARAVQTPSRWQVRRPIYAGSIGRWRDYAVYLPDLDAALIGPPA